MDAAQYITHASKSISSENSFTDWVCLKSVFSLSISGTWAGTVTVQRSFDKGTTAFDIEDYSGNIETIGIAAPKTVDVYYRAGIKTGNYTSGTAVVKIGA